MRRYLTVITQTFKARFEALYRPTDEGRYDVQLSDLQAIRENLERDAVMKILAARNVPVITTGERNAGPASVDAPIDLHDNPPLDLRIIRKLVDSCADGAPGSALGTQERLGSKRDQASKDKMAARKKSVKGKGKSQDPGKLIRSIRSGSFDLLAAESMGSARADRNEEGPAKGTSKSIRTLFYYWLMCSCVRCVSVGVKLDKEDLHRVNGLWQNIINPACIKWEQETGKPAEAYREAVAGVFDRQVTKFNAWNAWQRIWWHELPDVDDEGLYCGFISHLFRSQFRLCVLTTPCSGASQDVPGEISGEISIIERREARSMDAGA